VNGAQRIARILGVERGDEARKGKEAEDSFCETRFSIRNKGRNKK